ncbi:MAG: hypothetical protein KIT60_12010 [Burkholderiaceae bacterium]|nr:hypothetical protein [Burkholderiaceae bacterium]
MGFLIVFGFGILAQLALVSFAAIVISSFRCARIPLYWILALCTALTMALFLDKPLRASASPNYFWLDALLATAISWWSVAIFLGSLVTLGLALTKADWLRSLSGASWGFGVLLAVRCARVLSAG